MSNDLWARLDERSFVDGNQRDFFNQIGRTRSPFQNVGNWPLLEDEFERTAKTFVAELGREDSIDAGVEFVSGNPTLRPDSPAAEDVIQRIEESSGGFLHESHEAVVAVRILRSRKHNQRFGLGLQLETCQSNQRNAAGEIWLEQPTGIRLGKRGEQLLWLIHAEVMRNRKSLVSIPVSLIKEVVWGNQIPKDWRRDVALLFGSLSKLRFEVMNLNRRGWQPRLGATSSLIDHVEFSWELGELASDCDPTCRHWGLTSNHHHVRVGIGHGFLGVLESCANGDGLGQRLYDFKLPRNLRSQSEPVFPMLNAIIGRNANLRDVDRMVVQGIAAETTVVGAHPALQVGNITPWIDVPCPFLMLKRRYVSFNGNGKMSGKGYRLIGSKKTGWIFKTGLLGVAENHTIAVRKLLQSLDRLAREIEIVATAFSPSRQKWFSVDELKSLSRRRNAESVLDELILRVYAPEDFFENLHGSFHDFRNEEDWDRESEDIGLQLLNSGLTQSEIASHLRVSRPFISSLLNGRREWPKARIEQAKNLLAALDAQVSVNGSPR